jgi:hypothetical protein
LRTAQATRTTGSTRHKQGCINHIGFLLDASSSMSPHTQQVIEAADGQIQHLAHRSQVLDQETRVTVYAFADGVECLIYDKDVLRLPSIRDLYRPYGNTALIDATIQACDDLALTPEIYGDHAFLIYAFTDGEENRSNHRPYELQQRLAGLPDNWTVGALVPNASGKHEAKRAGFAADNVAVWDPNSQTGFLEAVGRMQAATEAFMTGRATGVRGTRSLFSTGADAVNKQTVAAAGLTPLQPSEFMLVPVPYDSPIREFVEGCGRTYQLGRAYYELTKTESIQPQKDVAIVEKRTKRVYVGRAARQLVGLPDVEVRVKPDRNPDFTIFVQSTSVNRKLVAHTQLLLLTGR